MLLALNTFRECVRDRILTAVLAFGALLVATSVVLAPLTLGESSKVIRDLGLFAISLFSMLMIILIGTGMVYREIEGRTIQTILTHPVRRASFILGKFFGLYATVLVTIALLAIVYFAVVQIFGGGMDRNLPLAITIAAMEALIVTAIALFFSTVASPFLSAIFTFFVFVAGHLAGDLKELVQRFESESVELLATVMYFVLPSLHQFDVRNNVLSGIPVPLEQVFHCLTYTVLYSTAVLLLTILAFQKRDFE
jgi:ABC-type transport system involved in multi-copper enzyme maturation permease subunit